MEVLWLRLHRTSPHDKASFGLNIKVCESWGALLIGTQFHSIQGNVCHPGPLPSSRARQLLPRSTVSIDEALSIVC